MARFRTIDTLTIHDTYDCYVLDAHLYGAPYTFYFLDHRIEDFAREISEQAGREYTGLVLGRDYRVSTYAERMADQAFAESRCFDYAFEGALAAAHGETESDMEVWQVRDRFNEAFRALRETRWYMRLAEQTGYEMFGNMERELANMESILREEEESWTAEQYRRRPDLLRASQMAAMFGQLIPLD